MYGVGVDMWAVGCILAELLLRVSPDELCTSRWWKFVSARRSLSFSKKPTNRPVFIKAFLNHNFFFSFNYNVHVRGVGLHLGQCEFYHKHAAEHRKQKLAC